MTAGIFSGMKSYPSREQVVDDLGDKVIFGLAKSVHDTRQDLAVYRRLQPGVVAQHSARGLANWVHDRLWYHLGVNLGDIDEVSFVDREPHRELYVGLRYHFRVKRHSDIGRVRSYPTQAVLNFYGDGAEQGAFEGFDEVRLTTGYTWDRQMRDIGPGIITLPKNRKEAEWVFELPEPDAGMQADVTPLPPISEPPAPVVYVEDDEDDADSGNDLE